LSSVLADLGLPFCGYSATLAVSSTLAFTLYITCVVGGWTSANLSVNGAETIFCSELSDRMMQIEYLRIGLTHQMMKQELV